MPFVCFLSLSPLDAWFRFFMTIHCNLTAHHNDDISRWNSTYSRLLAWLLVFFLPLFLLSSATLVESVRVESTTDSSIGMAELQYKRTRARTSSKMSSCREKRKKNGERGELLIVLVRRALKWEGAEDDDDDGDDDDEEEEKRDTIERKREKENVANRLFTRGIHFRFSLSLLDGDSSHWLLLPLSLSTTKDLFVFELSLSTIHANKPSLL